MWPISFRFFYYSTVLMHHLLFSFHILLVLCFFSIAVIYFKHIFTVKRNVSSHSSPYPTSTYTSLYHGGITTPTSPQFIRTLNYKSNQQVTIKPNFCNQTTVTPDNRELFALSVTIVTVLIYFSRSLFKHNYCFSAVTISQTVFKNDLWLFSVLFCWMKHVFMEF